MQREGGVFPVLSNYSAEPILGKNSRAWTTKDSCRILRYRATIERLGGMLRFYRRAAA